MSVHKLNECYMLNDMACISISDGNYEEAIALLTEGLKHSLSFNCCKFYSLQSCFLREERVDEEEQDSNTCNESSSVIEVVDDKTNNDETTTMDCCSIDKIDDCYGFVYQRALRVNNMSSIEQIHYTGSTLRVIIVFNLALAHHLKAIETIITTAAPNSTTKLLQQSLHLYMVAYRLHTEYEEQQQQEQKHEPSSRWLFNSNNLGSLRFVMIISNNISEIHRILNDTNKHVRCLEHVLSCIMNTVVNFNNHSNNYLHCSIFELDGFYHNISGNSRYAPAA
jgi:hypothetical protein